MEYVQPVGGLANDPYLDANPVGGIEGSPVPAAAIEHPMRELVALITDAGLAPTDASLTQVAAAVRTLMQTQAASISVAGGTADAITAAYTPAIIALTNGMTLYVRAASANATATPTFKADGTAAFSIVKGNNLPLVAGDIAGAGHWVELRYDSVLDKWVIANPASTVAVLGAAKNLVVKNNTATPASKIDVAADEIALKSAGGSALLATAFFVTADITVGGANGLDTGAAANNTWYYIWVISNGATAESLLSTSSTAPTLPVGYTYKALIGAVYRTTAFRNFTQRGSRVQAAEQWQTLSGGTATGLTSVSMSTFVPPIHKQVTVADLHSTPASLGQSAGNVYAGNAVGKVVGSVYPYSSGNTQSDWSSCTFIPEVAQTYYYNVSSGSSTHYIIDFEI
jgi:hypothetical protein